MSILDDGNEITAIRTRTLAHVIAALDAGNDAALNALGVTFRAMMSSKEGTFEKVVTRARFLREWRSPRTPVQIAALDSAIAEWRAERPTAGTRASSSGTAEIRVELTPLNVENCFAKP